MEVSSSDVADDVRKSSVVAKKIHVVTTTTVSLVDILAGEEIPLPDISDVLITSVTRTTLTLRDGQVSVDSATETSPQSFSRTSSSSNLSIDGRVGKSLGILDSLESHDKVSSTEMKMINDEDFDQGGEDVPTADSSTSPKTPSRGANLQKAEKSGFRKTFSFRAFSGRDKLGSPNGGKQQSKTLYLEESAIQDAMPSPLPPHVAAGDSCTTQPNEASDEEAAVESEADRIAREERERRLKEEEEFFEILDERNVWEEPLYNKCIIYQKDVVERAGEKPVDPEALHAWYKIKAASFNRLILLLTPANRSDSDEWVYFVETFFMVYRSFTDHEGLFNKLMERYTIPVSKFDSSDSKQCDEFVSIQMIVCEVIGRWIEACWADFSGQLMDRLNDFISRSVKDSLTQSDTRHALEFLEQRVRKKRELGSYSALFDPTKVLSKDAPEPKLPKNVDWSIVQLMEIDAEELARQITIPDYHLYAEIRPSELLQQVWTKPALRDRCPNVIQWVERFNRFSQAVATMIIEADRVKLRRLIVQKFIKILVYLERFNNFNGMMAIMSGFENSAVHRLKYTFDEGLRKPDQQKLQRWRDLLSSQNSYASFRKVYTSIQKGPCMPFLGVFLTDLIFIDEGNKERIGQLINYSKNLMTADVIRQILRFQKDPYQLKLVPQVLRLIDTLPILTNDQLYMASLKLEPRGASEKDIL